MPLIDLRTDLKSLKYGHDRPDGGSSNQPYIKVDINTVDSDFNQFRLTRFDDGLIRGGIVSATNASVVDTLRIGKFFTDLPRGPLFIAKQVGLQLSNPRVESSILPTNAPTSGQGFLTNVGNVISNVANRIENVIGPTRIYNLGVNTLAQIPVNAFGGHIVRHGFLPNNDSSKYYENVVTTKNNANGGSNNRLVKLKNELGLISNRGFNRIQKPAPNIVQEEIGLDNPYLTKNVVDPSVFSPSTSPDWIYQTLPPKTNTDFAPIPIGGKIDSLSYFGGPGSVYGIGNTNIRRSTNTENRADIEKSQNHRIFAGKTRNEKGEPTDINYANTLGISKFYFGTVKDIRENTDIDIERPDKKPSNLDTTTYTGRRDKSLNLTTNTIPPELPAVPITNFSFEKYKKIIESKKLTSNYYDLNGAPVNQFGIYKNNNQSSGITVVGNLSPDATTYPIYYSNANESVISFKLPWNEIAREQRIGDFGRQDIRVKIKSGSVVTNSTKTVKKADSINLTPIFTEGRYYSGNSIKIPSTEGGVTYNTRDLAKFVIQAVNTNTPDTSRHMVFRALLTGITDSVDAKWNDINYVGRGTPFYIYGGSSRKVSFKFKVAALSAEEMGPMYTKLNLLMSSLMPDYSTTTSNGVMRGGLHRLTIGNYLDAQLGIMNSVSYTIPDDAPWEISLDEPEGGSQYLILPHIIEVSMDFTPIGVETKGVNRIEDKNVNISYIAQNNTGKDKDTIQYTYTDFGYVLYEDLSKEDQATKTQADQQASNQTISNPSQTSTQIVAQESAQASQAQYSIGPGLVENVPNPGVVPVYGPNGEIINVVNSEGNNALLGNAFASSKAPFPAGGIPYSN